MEINHLANEVSMPSDGGSSSVASNSVASPTPPRIEVHEDEVPISDPRPLLAAPVRTPGLSEERRDEEAYEDAFGGAYAGEGDLPSENDDDELDAGKEQHIGSEPQFVEVLTRDPITERYGRSNYVQQAQMLEKDSLATRIRLSIGHGKTLRLAQMVLSLFACALLVWEAYRPSIIRSPILFVWYGLGICFALIWLAECLTKDTNRERLIHMRSWTSIIDYITIVVIYFAPLAPLSFLRALRILRIYDSYVMLERIRTNVYYAAAYNLFFSFLAFAFIAVILIHRVEGLPPHTGLYYFVVTITTVGYGDISPQTELGRIVVILLLCFMFVVIPIQSAALVDLILSRSKYFGRVPVARVNHVVVLGSISYENLKNLTHELYHKDKVNVRSLRVVVMQDCMPSEAIKSIVLKYYPFVQYLSGSGVSEEDLARLSLQHASACYILANRRSTTPMTEDSHNILRALAVRKESVSIPIFAQVLLPSNKRHFRMANTSLFLCVTEMKLGVIAKSIPVPGATTLIRNLIVTSTNSGKTPIRFQRGELIRLATEVARCCSGDPPPLTWISEYAAGMDMEIYVMSKVPPAMVGRMFGEIVEFVAKENCLLIGLIRSTRVILNPGPCEEVLDDHKLVFISKDYSFIKRLRHMELDIPDRSHIPIGPISSAESEGIVLDLRNVGPEEAEQYFHMGGKQNQEDLIFETIPRKVVDHIIITGTNRGLYYLIAPLRSKSAPLRPIVLIVEEPIHKSTWRTIRHFKELYIVVGLAHTHSSMLRAGIQRAGTAIILHSPASESDSEFLNDSNAILTYMAISFLNPTVDIRIEIGIAGNIGLFVPKGRRPTSRGNYAMMPTLADGTIFTDGTFDSLIGQIFHNPYIVRITQKLIHSAQLQLVAVPEEFWNCTVAEVRTQFLYDKGWLVVGVFRSPQVLAAFSFYVITNPPDSLELARNDRLYVLLTHSSGA